MRETYEPDPRFVEKLEWQLASEFRRADSPRSRGRIAVPRGVVVLAVVAGVFLTGVAATKAADLIKDSWRKKIELAKAETEVKVQKAFAEFKAEQAVKAEDQASQGLLSQEASQDMRLMADRSVLDLQKKQLNLEEVEASGKAPHDELYAPLVGGRDFIAERLEIETKLRELDLELRRSRVEQRLRQLVQKGLVTRHDLPDLQAAKEDWQAEIESARERLDLRRQFTAGRLSAQEVEIRDRMALAERDLRQAQSHLDTTKRDLADQRELLEQGLTRESVVRAMELGLNAAQEELALANLTIEILKGIK